MHFLRKKIHNLFNNPEEKSDWYGVCMYRCINEHFQGKKTIILIFIGYKSLSFKED